jgi:peptidoglycan/LPS O-acetylase OafA/YrhL
MKIKTGLPALTGLRFIAAIWVVFFHFLSIPWMESNFPRFLFLIIRNGYCGVDLFFVLSGFILAYNYYDRLDDSLNSKKSFWIARFSRIYPVYFLSFLISAPIVLSYRFLNSHSALVALGKAVVSAGAYLTLMQAWLWPMSRTWNGPAWTLSVEMLFYACFPFLLKKLGNQKTRVVVIVAVFTYLAGLAIPLIQYLSNNAFPEDFILDNPLFHLPTFILGIALFKVWNAREISNRFATALIAVGLAIIIAISRISELLPVEFLHNGLLAPAFCLIIYGLAYKGWPHRLLSNKPLVILGESSYSMYLLQYPVWWLAIAIYEKFKILDYVRLQATREFPQGLLFFGVCCISLVTVSIITFFFIEKPGRILIRRWFAKRMAFPRSQTLPFPENF